MTSASSNQLVLSDVVSRNEARHRVSSQLTTDVAHDPAPVLLVVGVPLEVEGASNLSDLHFVEGVEHIEEDLEHQVTPATLEDGLHAILEHPLVLVRIDESSELAGVLDDLLLAYWLHPLPTMLGGIPEHSAVADAISALAIHVEVVC